MLAIESRSPEETERIGERLAATLRGGESIGLVGELGAGKTCLVRGLARGLGVEPAAVYSPSFTLAAEYAGRLPLHHLDLFRLGDPVTADEAREIGLDDYLGSTGVTVIEWASRLADEPLDLVIRVEVGDGNRRTLHFAPATARGEAVARELAKE
jgi:tRNA threonylcarbamoyladenosine biosynthesis protein TsaE